MREPVADATVRPCHLPGTRAEQREGRVVVCDADQKVVLALNESAAALWELCDGRTTIEEMVMAICAISPIAADQAREDVERALTELQRAGVLAFDG
jgi:hypothetical protein